MPRLEIASIDDRQLEPYRNLKFTSAMRRDGLFVAEGDKLVRQLLHSRFRVHSVLAGEEFLARGSLQIPPDVTTFVAPDSLLREIVGFKFHRGVLACGFRGNEPCLSDVLDQAPAIAGNSAAKEATSPVAAVVCIDIQDPTNLGTILRTAEAFGVAAVVLGGDCADPFSRRVLRVSMGSPFQLPIAHSTDLASDLASLRQREKMSLIAAVADSTGEPFDRVDPPDRFAILLGNESTGLSTQWLDLCDRRVTIPMTPRADSLNVAVATGILLYHFCKPGAG
jgi:tRNA G18 (ribose-2'-O)-methylase SpoU